MSNLGRLRKIDLRHEWPTEAQDFTPWLAREENLALLGETLQLDLELEAVEQNVGPFRADILCKDTLSDRWVLVENQLERTDHTHLGQLITYAAGLSAVTIVWIAARVADEHRAAMDWLNEITGSENRFFALEVELWRIGDSPAAPKFNVVSKPNDWSRSTSSARNAIAEGPLSEPRQMLLDYWTGFEATLANRSSRIRTVKPQILNYMVHGLGTSGATLNTSLNRRENWIRAEVYLSGKMAQARFNHLREEKEIIEADLGTELIWYDKAPSDRRIFLESRIPDVSDRDSWPEQHAWLVQTLETMHKVFSGRIKLLNVEDWLPDESSEGQRAEES